MRSPMPSFQVRIQLVVLGGLFGLAACVGRTAPPAAPALTPPPENPSRAEERHLLLLRRDALVVGLLPQLGGRVVLLRTATGSNLLATDTTIWADPESAPLPDAEAPYIPYNGHEIWLGPQRDWWSQQSLNRERQSRQAIWPPDPWGSLGRCTVTDQGEDHVTLVGPDSPITGIRLTKEVRLIGRDQVRLVATARNMRPTPVSWGLWSNTRLPGSATCYVPFAAGDALTVDLTTRAAAEVEALAWRSDGGAFRFLAPAALAPGKTLAFSKAHIATAAPQLVAYLGGMCLIKTLLTPADGPEAPGHSAIEVFQAMQCDPAHNLLELEFHSTYRSLAPGDELVLSELWTVRPYSGSDTDAGHLAHLAGIGSGL